MEAIHNHLHESPLEFTGVDADLDLAEMEIASGRFGEARLRFAKMLRLQRESPRALLLRAKATETEESRRMLASFVRTALDRHHDALSRSYLAAALALCGDRTAALQHLPHEKGMTSVELGIRQQALDALGSVPDLPETSDSSLTAMISRKLVPDRRTR